MVSTILGPATVLLMLAGAFTVVFKTSVLASYCIALLPAIAFIAVCICAKPDTQVTIASIMSAAYAIVMTIVLVATIGQAIEGGLTSPNVIFLVMLVFIFFISALLHPEEFFCVIPGALYFICLPTGYLLLTIYYLCNMNVVSWGTREIPRRKTKEQIEQENREAEEKRLKKAEKNKGMFGWMGLTAFFKEFGDVLRQVRSDVGTQSKSRSDQLLEQLIWELRTQRGVGPDTTLKGKKSNLENEPLISVTVEKADDVKTTDAHDGTNHEEAHLPLWLQPEELDSPSWLTSTTCGVGPIKRLNDRENIFWKQIIAKYLHPINEDKIHQEKVENDLRNLRNNVVFGFFMSSAVWVAMAMQLQILQDELKESLFIKIPRFDSDEPLSFEPLGLLFLAFFATILSVQFLGMLAHRWGTVMHMLSITDISCGKKFTEKDKVRDIISKAMELQKLCNIENEPMPNYDDPLPDYDYSDDEETVDTMSVKSFDSWSAFQLGYYPASVTGANVAGFRKQAIFDRRGHSSGAALRKAFEKRFRNESTQFRMYPCEDELEGSVSQFGTSESQS